MRVCVRACENANPIPFSPTYLIHGDIDGAGEACRVDGVVRWGGVGWGGVGWGGVGGWVGWGGVGWGGWGGLGGTREGVRHRGLQGCPTPPLGWRSP